MLRLAAFAAMGLLMTNGMPSRALAQDKAQDRDQIACEPDVHRLCEDVFPDVDLVATCLVTKRQQLSIGCATALAHPPDDTSGAKEK